MLRAPTFHFDIMLLTINEILRVVEGSYYPTTSKTCLRVKEMEMCQGSLFNSEGILKRTKQ